MTQLLREATQQEQLEKSERLKEIRDLKSTGLSPICSQNSCGSKRAGLSPICTHDSVGCKRAGLSPICTQNSMLEQLSLVTVKSVHSPSGRQEMNMMTLLQEATAEEQESKRVALLYESECEEIVMELPPVSTATTKIKSVRFGSATIIPTAEVSSSLIPAMPEKSFLYLNGRIFPAAPRDPPPPIPEEKIEKQKYFIPEEDPAILFAKVTEDKVSVDVSSYLGSDGCQHKRRLPPILPVAFSTYLEEEELVWDEDDEKLAQLEEREDALLGWDAVNEATFGCDLQQWEFPIEGVEEEVETFSHVDQLDEPFSVTVENMNVLPWFDLATSSKMLATRSAQRQWHAQQRRIRLQADLEFFDLQEDVCEPHVRNLQSKQIQAHRFSAYVRLCPVLSRTVLTKNVHTRRLRRFCTTSAPFSKVACRRQL